MSKVNKEYSDWDSIIVQINQGDKGVANIKMMRQDVESMEDLHGMQRGEVIDMLVKALEDEYVNRENAES